MICVVFERLNNCCFKNMKTSSWYAMTRAVNRIPSVSRWTTFARWARYRKLQIVVATIIIFTFGHLLLNRRWTKSMPFSVETAGEKKGLKAEGDTFLLDGHPFRIFSGAIHYFRVPRAYWRDRLMKLKAAGLNTVETYVAWNMHEPQRGRFDFSDDLDLVEFIKTAGALGLYVILRPGPYICAEWDWGGLPPWLLHDPDMKVRTTYKGYTEAVEAYFAELFQRVSPLQYQKSKNGGSIIAVQIENEYGAYGEDKEYLQWLKNTLVKNGVVELLFTSDGPKDLARGTLPDVFATVNFNFKPDDALNALQKFQPDRPLMVAEFWSGWFDHWTEKHHVIAGNDFSSRLEPILKRGASINFYMFHGGTNFGFMNGANLIFKTEEKGTLLSRFFLWMLGDERTRSSADDKYALYQPTVTSYDYHAPLNENGGPGENFNRMRDLIRQYSPSAQQTQSMGTELSDANKPVSYGEFPVQSVLLLTDVLAQVGPLPITLENPVFVEKLLPEKANQLYYGFIVYRTTLTVPKNAKTISLTGVYSDRMLVVVNGETAKTLFAQYDKAPFNEHIDISKYANAADVSEEGNERKLDLILLVENMGRANYVKYPHSIDGTYKGFDGYVTVTEDGAKKKVKNWRIYSLRFETPNELKTLSAWKTFTAEQSELKQPVFYKFSVKLNMLNASDTFLNMKDWTKGVVFANGVNLGRYWNVGPQKTLYLPGVWLKKSAENEVVVFELHKAATKIKLQAEPGLGEPCPLPCYW